MTDYQRIARAITYINEHAGEQPGLEEIAASVPLSPYHFHRLFSRWAGVTPKEFLQYISLERAREVLNANGTLADAADRSGLSGTGRLHDLFVKIEGMTPGEYKNGGEALSICCSGFESPFGEAFVASTGRGLCRLSFGVTPGEGIRELKNRWPEAEIREGRDRHAEGAIRLFSGEWDYPAPLKLHLRGTPFQIRVWEALLKIPPGRLSTYSGIAGAAGSPSAFRAVGTAVGCNPVAWLIPCHRVIRKSGVIGGYRWGTARKSAMIGWEAAKLGPGQSCSATGT